MILFRAVFTELITPLMLTLGVTTFVLMMGKIYNLISLMVDRRMDAGEVSRMFLYLVPQAVTVMLPIGVLGAVTVVVLRHSAESELVAMRSAGQSLARYARPIMVFGVLLAVVTAVMTLWVQPAGNRNFLRFQVAVIREHAEDSLLPGEMNTDFGDKVIRINERLPDREVLGVFLADRELRPGSPVVTAERGRILVDEENQQVVFRLRDGDIFTEEEDPTEINDTRFDTLNYVLELTGRRSVDTIEVEVRWTYSLDELLRRIGDGATPPMERIRLLMELFTRLSTPFACLGFAVAAIPLATVDPRAGRPAVILKAIALVLAYYVMWIGCRDLILSGSTSPAVLFAPPLFMLLFGAVGIWREDRAGAG